MSYATATEAAADAAAAVAVLLYTLQSILKAYKCFKLALNN